MEKDVLITLYGTQKEMELQEVSDEEIVEVICPGTYFFKDGLHYIFYEEVDEDSQRITKNKIVFKENDYVEVVKKGATNSNMYFEIGAKHTATYDTPFGTMELTMITSDMNFQIEEERIILRILYSMGLNGAEDTQCEITIKILEKCQGI